MTSLASKPGESSKIGEAAKDDAIERAPIRQGLHRMGTWGFKGKGTEAADKAYGEEEDDDRRIRFTIGGAGRRLTKEDFLKEIQSLDPKARCEIVAESDAPEAMKAMAQKDASEESPGSSRLFQSKNAQAASGKGTASAVGAEMARQKGARVDHAHDAGERPQKSRARALSDLARGKKEKGPQQKGTNTKKEYNDQSQDAEETPAERRRREEALRGVEEEDEEEQQPMGERRGRTQGREEQIETAAERRRREAALGVGEEEEDSDDDDTPRVRPPAAKSRGIRFAESPVRGK